VRQQRGLYSGEQHKDPGLALKEWLDGGAMRINRSFSGRNPYGGRVKEIPPTESMQADTSLCKMADNCDLGITSEILKCGAGPNSRESGGQTALHEAVRNDHFGHSVDSKVGESTAKRVTIHIHSQKTKMASEEKGKLINLPGSLQELLQIGGKSHLA